jgi:lactate racemase
MVELPYGRVPYPLDLGSRPAVIVEPPRLSEPRALSVLLDEALAAPLGRPPVERLLRRGDRLTVIVSDVTRDEPRRAFLEALRPRIPAGVTWTIAIATGTHGPCGIERLDLPEDLVRAARIVDHDGHRDTDLVMLGITSRGTPVPVHRCVVEADLVIATGCIRPHYFAGFGAGAKAVFPGLGGAGAIRRNHQLKTEPTSRAGIVDGNPCRADLEEAVALLRTPTFLLDGVCGPDHRIHAAVAGDLVDAFRRGADLARPWFTVRSPRASLVIASDTPPVTSSLYQAAKIAAAVADLVAPAGTLALVAECPDGVGPLATVNEAIFRIGVLPRLAPGVSIELISTLASDVVAQTLVHHAPSLDELVARSHGPIVVVPRASQLLCEATS